MGQPIAITRLDHAASDLREVAARCQDGAVVRRLLALALVLDGRSRHEAAAQTGMDRQTLRDWVHRYNDAGIAGLTSRCAPGRAAALSAREMAELKALVLQGPDLSKDNVVRWRCVDLRERVIQRFSVAVHERTIGKWLRRLNLKQLQPRPCHPKTDFAAQEAFKKQARSGGPPGAVETGCAMIIPRGAAGKFLVDMSPAKNVAHESLRTYGW